MSSTMCLNQVRWWQTSKTLMPEDFISVPHTTFLDCGLSEPRCHPVPSLQLTVASFVLPQSVSWHSRSSAGVPTGLNYSSCNDGKQRRVKERSPGWRVKKNLCCISEVLCPQNTIYQKRNCFRPSHSIDSPGLKVIMPKRQSHTNQIPSAFFHSMTTPLSPVYTYYTVCGPHSLTRDLVPLYSLNQWSLAHPVKMEHLVPH